MEEEMTDPKLDAFEQSVEDDADNYVSAQGTKRAQIEALLDGVKKTRNINIRISEFDLDRLKSLSSKEGLPYQTLISSVLHKFVTNQLIDEKTILQSLKILNQ
jgi:predicted DNA binding CopG/RHH family protein